MLGTGKAGAIEFSGQASPFSALRKMYTRKNTKDVCLPGRGNCCDTKSIEKEERLRLINRGDLEKRLANRFSRYNIPYFFPICQGIKRENICSDIFP
jgi:hypothetical protein